MKNFILLVALFLVAPFAQGSSPQHLLVGGSGWNKIAIINKDTKRNSLGISSGKRLGM